MAGQGEWHPVDHLEGLEHAVADDDRVVHRRHGCFTSGHKSPVHPAGAHKWGRLISDHGRTLGRPRRCQGALVASGGVPEEPIDRSRRTWPQRLLIGFNLVFVVGLVTISNRLDSFEEAVESIVRIEVPAGVLADLPGSPEVAEVPADPATGNNPTGNNPTGPESGVGRFIERRGEGLHHLAFNVTDISGKLMTLKTLGVDLIDETPREGLSGTIAFVHPRSVFGILTELVETNPHS